MANTKGVKKHKKAAKPKPPESLGPEPESLSWLDLEPFEFDLEPFEWPDLGALSWPDLGTFELPEIEFDLPEIDDSAFDWDADPDWRTC